MMVDRHRSQLTLQRLSAAASYCAILLLLLSVTSPPIAHACPYASARACAGSSNASVYLEDGAWVIKEGIVDKQDSLAYGSYEEQGGWSILDMAASSHGGGGRRAMFALGYLEGHFTCELIDTFYANYRADLFGDASGGPGHELLGFITENHDWLRKKALEASPGSPDGDYWGAVGGVLAQMDGLLAGYSASCPGAQAMTTADILLLNMLGDLYDIMPALDTTNEIAKLLRKSRRTGLIPDDPIHVTHNRTQRCSAAVKLDPGATPGEFVDITVGHTTWDSYTNAFPRLYKHVSLPAADGSMYTETFSSSPGLLSSMDDFYVTSGPSSLFVLETSLDVLDGRKYKLVTPESAPCWVRVIVANRLARCAESWSGIFAAHHSGTYNNQWMVVNRDRFHPGTMATAEGHQGEASGLFWLTEEAPGSIVAQDMTWKLLEDGYWASYNVPFFPEIRKALGYETRSSDEARYDTATRAKEFRQLVSRAEASGLAGMHWLMSWNDWGSGGSGGSVRSIAVSPSKAIASRGDLVSAADYALTPPELRRGPRAAGAIDSKAAAWSAWETPGCGGPSALIQLGPTTQQQPPFCWTGAFLEPHQGHPGCFEYPPIEAAFSKLHPGLISSSCAVAAEEQTGGTELRAGLVVSAAAAAATTGHTDGAAVPRSTA